MQCKVPGCQKQASTHYYNVDVCGTHRDLLKAEADEFYKKIINRKFLFESIRHLTPWKDTEPGDIHKAMVKKIRNGVVTIYEIRGGRYVLDHPSAYKGAKAK